MVDEETTPMSDVPSQEGLIGVWYGATDFKKPKAVDHMTTLDVDWHDFQQPGEDRETQWSAIWEGSVIGPADREVTFHVASDFGVKLFIGSHKVIDWEGLDTEASGTFTMEKGAVYPISIQYVHSKGERSFIDVTWSWAGREEVSVPTSHLRHSPAQARKMRGIVPRIYLPGHHSIGFRVVQAEWPETQPVEAERPFFFQCVAQEAQLVEQGPD